MGRRCRPPLLEYKSAMLSKPIFQPSSTFITRLSPRAFLPRNLSRSRLRANANGFMRIHRHNIQFGSRNWKARLPAGLASTNFFRDALIAVLPSSAFTSANNFDAVAWAENYCRKGSRAPRNLGYTRSLD